MDLDLYTKKINEEHAKCQDAAKDMFQHGMEAGRFLLEVKEALPHGHFGKWLEENFDGSRSVAAKYMGCFRAVNTGMVPMPEGNTSLERVLKAMREQNAELEPEEPAAPREPEPPASEADYEPEVEGEEYDFSSQEEYDEFFGEGAAAAAATKEAAPREPTPSDVPPPEPPARRERNPLESAFNAIDKALRDVQGEEKAERIKLLREHLDMYEAAPVEPSRKREPRKKAARSNGAAAEPAPKKIRGKPVDVDPALIEELQEALDARVADAEKKKVSDMTEDEVDLMLRRHGARSDNSSEWKMEPYERRRTLDRWLHEEVEAGERELEWWARS
jgi:hypothetical protein